jgi:hypothetical protein
MDFRLQLFFKEEASNRFSSNEVKQGSLRYLRALWQTAGAFALHCRSSVPNGK